VSKQATWTPDKVQFLIDNYQKMTALEISEVIDKTKQAIYTKMKNLKLKKQVLWTPEQEQFLKDNIATMTFKEMSAVIGKSERAVDDKAQTLGLYRPLQWTLEEEQFLIQNYKSMANKELSKKLNKSVSMIQRKAGILGLTQKLSSFEERKKFLVENYGKITTKQLAQAMDIKESTVRAMANKLGLTKELHYWTPEQEDLLRKYYPDIKYSVKYISKLLNKTIKQIQNKVAKIGICRIGAPQPWTTKQVKYLDEMYSKTSDILIGIELDRSPNAIKSYARNVRNLKKLPQVHHKTKIKMSSRIRRNWEPQEINYLLENVSYIHIFKMMKFLNRSYSTIEKKMINLGIAQNRLKLYHLGNYRFYYVTEEEKQQKIKYCEFWHHAIFDKKIERCKQISRKRVGIQPISLFVPSGSYSQSNYMSTHVDSSKMY
jgi:predicted transcriptional regulator